jgi:phosphohistidine phosphatase SixA
MENGMHSNNAIKDLQNKSQVLLIRHGKSVANVEYDSFEGKDKNHILDNWTLNKDIRDSRLAPLGIEQAQSAAITMNQIKVNTVLVSPLRRTLETAYNIFKEHPDFSKIKFIVVPNLRESMNTSSDIPENIENIREEFTNIIPHLDFSLMNNYKNHIYYYLEDMSPEFNDKIIEKLSQNESNEYIDPTDAILEEIRSKFPEKNESKWNALARTKIVKAFTKDYITKNIIPYDEKIVLVTHFVYCYMHTGKWSKEHSRDEDLPMPDEFIKMDNCSIASDPTDYSHF